MYTPQELEQISFGKATFGGYDMKDVDAVLEPLTADYVTLYKENALLKSKMRALVAKLEEYRKNEESMKAAVVEAQKTCDRMVKEAEDKCAQMLQEANANAVENCKNADALVAAENERIEEAKRTAASKIEEIQEEIRTCLNALDRIKQANRPVNAEPVIKKTPITPSQTSQNADAVANEISQSLQNLVGTAEDTVPKAEPKHPKVESTTSKFANLRFGRNYNQE